MFNNFLPSPPESLNKASVSYEEAAVLQKHVLGEMFLRLKLLKINPEIILDLGCGPGNAGPDLKATYKPRDLIYLDFAYDMLKKAEQKNKDHFLKSFSNKTSFTINCGGSKGSLSYLFISKPEPTLQISISGYMIDIIIEIKVKGFGPNGAIIILYSSFSK